MIINDIYQLVALSLTLDYAKNRENLEELTENDSGFPSMRESFHPPPQYVNYRNWILGVVVGAIFLTTSVMSLLEPCLPLWLLKTMKPEV